MPTLRGLARSVRHAPGLEQMDFLWNAARRPYHRLLDSRRGARVILGGKHTVYLPAALAGNAWDRYEREAASAFGDWVKTHPRGSVFDIGAAEGMYTVLALACGAGRVVAIDSELASVRRTWVVAQRSNPNGRLQLIHGLIADRSTHVAPISVLHEEAMRSISVIGDATHMRYTNIGDEQAAWLPMCALDDLVPLIVDDMPVLIKMDIEGAEVFALRGAQRLLRRPNTTALISVHPQYLPRYGHNPTDVAALLDVIGIRYTVLAIDHEEHWWCTHEA